MSAPDNHSNANPRAGRSFAPAPLLGQVVKSIATGLKNTAAMWLDGRDIDESRLRQLADLPPRARWFYAYKLRHPILVNALVLLDYAKYRFGLFRDRCFFGFCEFAVTHHGGVYLIRGAIVAAQLLDKFKNLKFCHNGAMWPNDHHQRWEPAAKRSRIVSRLNGWLPSAEWCGVRLTWA